MLDNPHIVELDKDVDYVFCFKKKNIITEHECDYYDFNYECYKKHDILKMTHHFGSNSGISYVYSPNPLLNECKYCLDKDKLEKYELSDEAYKCIETNKPLVKDDGFFNKLKKVVFNE